MAENPDIRIAEFAGLLLNCHGGTYSLVFTAWSEFGALAKRPVCGRPRQPVPPLALHCGLAPQHSNVKIGSLYRLGRRRSHLVSLCRIADSMHLIPYCRWLRSIGHAQP